MKIGKTNIQGNKPVFEWNEKNSNMNCNKFKK
jgi:hypothetical protein